VVAVSRKERDDNRIVTQLDHALPAEVGEVAVDGGYGGVEPGCEISDRRGAARPAQLVEHSERPDGEAAAETQGAEQGLDVDPEVGGPVELVVGEGAGRR